MNNDELLFRVGKSLEVANQLVQHAWEKQVLGHCEAVKLRDALGMGLAAAQMLERLAAGCPTPKVGD